MVTPATRIAGILQRLGMTSQSNTYQWLRLIYTETKAFRGLKSYSQFGEDAILRQYLGTFGTYVEVGAGRPIRGSNTFALYRRGWHGTLIEPISRNAKALRVIRPRDKVVNALCGSHESTSTFWEFDPYEYSTTLDSRVKELARQCLHPVQVRSLPVVTLRSLGLTASENDECLLSIDVEGAEMDVLLGNDFDSFRPKIICIEEWESPLSHRTDVYNFLSDQGYVLEAFTRCSSIYVIRPSTD